MFLQWTKFLIRALLNIVVAAAVFAVAAAVVAVAAVAAVARGYYFQQTLKNPFSGEVLLSVKVLPPRWHGAVDRLRLNLGRCLSPSPSSPSSDVISMPSEEEGGGGGGRREVGE